MGLSVGKSSEQVNLPVVMNVNKDRSIFAEFVQFSVILSAPVTTLMATQNDFMPTVDTETAADTQPTSVRKIWLPFHFVLAAGLLVVVFLFNAHSVADPDIWWHLNNAEHLLRSGHIVNVDNFSWTAKGSPWIDHEWLAEIPFYFAFKAFGLRGLYTLSFILATVIIWLIFYRSYKKTGDIKNSFVVSVYCVLLTVVSFGPRMLLFGWLYMLIMLLALDRFQQGATLAAWIVPPLFLLWINSHGSWMIGLVIFVLIAGSGLVEFQSGLVESRRWSREQLKTLIAVGVLSVLVLFVNPYGYKLVAYPFDMAFHQKLNIEHVEEWASVDFHLPRGKVVYIGLAAVIALGLLSKKKLVLAELLLLILAFYSGLSYIRFLFLTAILISPFLSRRIQLFPPYNVKIDKPILNLVVIVMALGLIAWRYPSEAKLQEDMSNAFPTKSIQFLRSNNIRENVLTHFMWGGYLERYYPELPVFVDSRVDIFEYNGTLKDYLDLIGLKEPLAILDKRHIEYVYFKPSDHLVYLLKHTGQWDVMYEDATSILLRRRTAIALK